MCTGLRGNICCALGANFDEPEEVVVVVVVVGSFVDWPFLCGGIRSRGDTDIVRWGAVWYFRCGRILGGCRESTSMKEF